MSELSEDIRRLQRLLEPVLVDARLGAPEVTAVLSWDPQVFPQGEADPEFRADECFVLAVGQSMLTVPSALSSDADLQVWMADALQDAVVDSIGRAWPALDRRVLGPGLDPDGQPVWEDSTGVTHIRIGNLALHTIES